MLDLTVSNILSVQTGIRTDISYRLDYQTQVTIIPGRSIIPLEQFYYRITERDLPKFASLVSNRLAGLPNTSTLRTLVQINSFVTIFASILEIAIQTAGSPDRGKRRAIP